MIPSSAVTTQTHQSGVSHQSAGVRILCIVGPTASGKSSRAVTEALAHDGEVVSVDSRQVYRGLDIGTEKITAEEMCGIPHHLIDIREPHETYSAGDFVTDATRLIKDVSARGKLPILVGGTNFYFHALLHGLPMGIDANPLLREELKTFSTEELYARVRQADARRAAELDPQNRRRLIRALEIIESLGTVPQRTTTTPLSGTRLNLVPEWIVINPAREELRAKIDARLESAFARGLIDEVRTVRDMVGDVRLNELGLEYKIVGKFLNLEVGLPSGSPTSKLLFPALSAKLWQYARHQKAWLRKLGHVMS